MVKILKNENQYRITIPKEIIVLTGWDENTELIITPYIKDPSEKLTEDTAIIMKKIGNVGDKENGK